MAETIETDDPIVAQILIECGDIFNRKAAITRQQELLQERIDLVVRKFETYKFKSYKVDNEVAN